MRPSNVPVVDNFGARLALVRQRMSWGNVKEAAESCGLPVQSWRNWERDNGQPRDIVKAAQRISAVSGVNYYWLLDGNAMEMRGPIQLKGDNVSRTIVCLLHARRLCRGRASAAEPICQEGEHPVETGRAERISACRTSGCCTLRSSRARSGRTSSASPLRPTGAVSYTHLTLPTICSV